MSIFILSSAMPKKRNSKKGGAPARKPASPTQGDSAQDHHAGVQPQDGSVVADQGSLRSAATTARGLEESADVDSGLSRPLSMAESEMESVAPLSSRSSLGLNPTSHIILSSKIHGRGTVKCYFKTSHVMFCNAHCCLLR